MEINIVRKINFLLIVLKTPLIIADLALGFIEISSEVGEYFFFLKYLNSCVVLQLHIGAFGSHKQKGRNLVHETF